MQTYAVKLSTTSEMLGTAPANPQVYEDFIVAKRMAEGKFTKEEIEIAKKEELATLPVLTSGDEDQKGITIFRRADDGTLVIPGYMVKGFFKAAAASMSEVWGASGRIDRMVHIGKFTGSKFAADRFIPMVRDGQRLKAPDGTRRPLRAMTAQGERISLASSELVRPVVTLSFHVTVLPLAETGKGIGTREKPCLVNQELLESWLAYGMMAGIGQWRSAGWGTFTHGNHQVVMRNYTYIWLDEAGIPYYVGKGIRGRAYERHNLGPAPPPERILLFEQPSPGGCLQPDRNLSPSMDVVILALVAS